MPGEFRMRVDVEVEYSIVNTATGEDLPPATLTYSAEFSITCLDEAAAPRSFVLNFTKPEGMTYVNPTQLQTLSGFPIPNLTNESIPVVVAGTQNQFGPGLGTPLAVDIRTGSTLFAYAFNGVLFDAYPLVGPLDDPDGNVDRILAMSGQSGVALKGINENGTDGATLVDTSNRFAADTSYLLGAEQQAIVFTQPTAGATTNPGSIRVIRHSETSGLPGDFRFNRQRPFDPPSFEGGQGIMRSPKTAVGNADGTKLVVAGGPGAPAELRLVERTVDGQTITDTHTVIGNVGSDPRRIRCDELPPPRNDYLCGLTDFTDNTVQLFTWNLQSTVTLGPIVNVGQGPVGLDVKGNKIVVANFGDDSINYITFDPADPLNASLLTNQTLDLDAIPDINCDNPGHAIVIDDTEVSLPPGIIATVVASCNSSNNLAVIPIRFGF